jgi:hexulose-6-phosphate isomerase
MERRNFIKQTLLGTGALWVSSTTGKLLTKEATMIPQAPATGFYKSIMWGTVGLSGSVLDKCKVIKAAGYKGIEPNSHMNRNEVLAAMKETGLIASSVCCSTHWGKPLSSPDAAVRNEGLEGMRVAMEDAKAYGTDAVLLVPGVVNESISYDECWTRSTESIKELLPLAKKLGVKICIENVWNNFLLSPMEACTYIDQFKSPYVRFYFDCGNILVYGWPEQWVRILGDRIGRVHIKEFNKEIAERKGKGEGFNVKLTEGNINWKRVVEELRKSYKNNWLTTEQGGSKTPEELNDLSERFDKLLSL